MLTDKQEKLINKICLLCPGKPLEVAVISKVEKNLKVIFSDDFLEISKKYYYQWAISFFELLDFDLEGSHSVIYQTKLLRKNYNLPNRYVCLADDGTSMVFMETQDSPEKPSPVIWCAIEDMYRLAADEPMIYEPTIYPSFTNFFEQLVKDAEERSKEEEVE